MDFYLHSCYTEPEHLVAVAQAAEAAGFYGLTISDHIVYPKDLGSSYPYDYDVFPNTTPWPDPWVTLSHLAAHTATLRFINCIYVATMRDPIQIAKLVSTAAIFSDYRCDLAVAQGWMQAEFDIFGVPVKTLGARLDEQIEILRKLWTGDWVEHHGRFFDFPEVMMRPVPRGPIPIWGGGDSPRALARAARLDGFMGTIYNLERAKDVSARLTAALAEAGRAGEDYPIIGGYLTDDAGTPSYDDVRRYEEFGFTGMYVSPWETAPPLNRDPGLETLVASIERFGEEIIARG
jgi:probable F420-dependent oxidoreductase